MRYITIFILAAVFSSCGSALKIRVDVLNREALRKLPNVNKLEVEQLYIKLKSVEEKDLLNIHRADLKKIIRNNFDRLVNADILDTASRRSLQIKIFDKIDTEVGMTISQIKNANTDYETKIIGGTPNEADLLSVKGKLETSIIPFLQLKAAIEHEVDEPIDGLNLFFQQKNRELTLTEDELLDDILTSVVVHSPKGLWQRKDIKADFSVDFNRKGKRSAYSRTLVRTFMGNSDIAITMQNKGHFTIKGVRLDAAKVAEATFKGLTQSIHFLAMTSGVPVKKDETEIPILPELEQLTKSKVETRENTRLFNEGLLQTANTVLQQRVDMLGADATKKATAIKVIKEAFESHKTQFVNDKN